MKRERAWVLGGALLVLAAPVVRAADDDLSIVRKAVSADAGGSANLKDDKPAAPRKGSSPQWLRVRIVDKGEKKAKVSINLPLSLVRAMGDEVPLDWHCGKDAGKEWEPKKRCSMHMRLSEVLDALDSGQDVVQIEDGQSSIRVYVE
jgi:hypothetical protein